MQIVWKSGVGIAQLEDRLLKGAKRLELHLEAKDLENIEEVENRLEKYKEIVDIVHTPIQDKYNVEGLNSCESRGIILKTFDLAQRISRGERDIDVVLHQTLSLDRMKIWGMYDSILAQIYFAMRKYPNIVINLENLTIIGENSSDKTEYGEKKVVRDAFFMETFNLCKAIREDLQTDRIGLVWDTCHGISTQRIMRHLIDIGYLEDISYEKFLTTYIPYLNIIHLSNTRGYGYGKGHGTIFETEEEIEELRKLVKMIEDIGYKNKITLEVGEDSYTDVKNCVMLDKQIKNILNNFK